jgi:hypothetical protein
MPNSTRTNYTAAEVNSGMQNGFIQFMNQNRGKDPGTILQEMMASGQISQDQLNMAQAMAKRFEQQFSGLRDMFHF